MAKNNVTRYSEADPSFEHYIFSLMDKGELYFPRGVVYVEKDLAEVLPEREGSEKLNPKPAVWKPWGAWLGGRLSPIPQFRLALGVAAMVFLMMIAVWRLGFYPTELAEMAYIERPAIHTDRSVGARQDDPYLAYYQGVEALLESQFWKFQRVNVAKVDEAIRYLEQARKIAEAKQDYAYRVQINFYLAKAYLKKGQMSPAREQLKALTQFSPSTPSIMEKQAEAREILKAMEKLSNPGR